MKKKVLSKFLIVLGLSLLMVGLVGCASTSVDDGSPNPHKERTEEPQEKTPEGYYVYYTKDIRFIRGDKLFVKTVTDDYVDVVNIRENLTIIVNEKYSGTVLIAKHWQDAALDEVDDAELVVRTQDEKDIWEEAILEYLEEWERSEQLRLAPRDVFPPGFVVPKADFGSTVPDTCLGIYIAFAYLGLELEEDGDEVFGVMVSDVIKNSPAERVGLQRGDTIIALDGERFTTRSSLQEKILQHKLGDEVTLIVLRDSLHGKTFLHELDGDGFIVTLRRGDKEIGGGEEVEIVATLGTCPE